MGNEVNVSGEVRHRVAGRRFHVPARPRFAEYRDRIGREGEPKLRHDLAERIVGGCKRATQRGEGLGFGPGAGRIGGAAVRDRTKGLTTTPTTRNTPTQAGSRRRRW